MTKRYMGDGVYINHGSFRGEIILTTEDGVSETNKIVLEPSVWQAVLRWMVEQGFVGVNGCDDKEEASGN